MGIRKIDMTECKHDYSIGLWFCPYYDSDKENFIATCCQCGKIKYQRIRYTGRRKDGSRILRKI